jgi:hypothetical protein
MTPLKNVRQQVEFDIQKPPSHEKFSTYVMVCKKCHNMQTFLDIKEGEEEPT